METFFKNPIKMTDKELYGAIIELQNILIERRTTYERSLEDKLQFDIEYAAVVNEIATLRKNRDAFKLFSNTM